MQMAPEDLSSGLKQQGREADRPPTIGSEIRNKWSYASTSPRVLKARTGIRVP